MRSNEESQSLRVAIVQASPQPSDLASGLRKALALIEEAAEHGAELICFAVTFLPGYPAWLDFCPGAALWNHAPVKEVFAALRANSVIVPGNETKALGEAASRLRVGIGERKAATGRTRIAGRYCLWLYGHTNQVSPAPAQLQDAF